MQNSKSIGITKIPSVSLLLKWLLSGKNEGERRMGGGHDKTKEPSGLRKAPLFE